MKTHFAGERSAATVGALLGLAIAGCGEIHDGTSGALSSSAQEPAPADVVEAAPRAPLCNGTAGQWAGCRGNGCAVCAEKLTDFPSYFKNHPSCVRNTTCAGQFFTCNASCPAPTDADRGVTPPPMCDGVAGGWQGCRGTGCYACSELTDAYPAYFTNHPACIRNTTCAGQFFTCSANCPAPTDADKQPAPGTCDGTSGQWAGCRGNGCAVCAEKLTDFPSYFKNHPSCVKNTTCAGQFFTCNSTCPAPTNADRATMGDAIDGGGSTGLTCSAG